MHVPSPVDIEVKPWPEYRALVDELNAHRHELALAQQAVRDARVAVATAQRAAHAAQVEAVRAGKQAPPDDTEAHADYALEAAVRRQNAAVQVVYEDDARITDYLGDHWQALVVPLAKHIEDRRAAAAELASAAQEAQRAVAKLETQVEWLKRPGRARKPMRRLAPRVEVASVPTNPAPAAARRAAGQRR
jgi:hypothetical protein